MINIYIAKYKNFLPIDYVERKNIENKRKINIYIWLIIFLNIVMCVEISKENNKFEKLKYEFLRNRSKKESSLAEKAIDKGKNIEILLNNSGVLDFKIENDSFDIKVNEFSFNYVVSRLSDINGVINEITYDENVGVRTLKGEFNEKY